MTHGISVILMTLSDLQGHSPVVLYGVAKVDVVHASKCPSVIVELSVSNLRRILCLTI